jgi:16S rRNA A1518/A1519 N6-dimethyltransferase RsmA/KsgA/DIM1 with predicted DNA glycosylase/AP lyase activity
MSSMYAYTATTTSEPESVQQRSVQKLYTSACNMCRKIAQALPRSSDVCLEIGCSYGKCTELIAAAAGTVIGVDNSKEVQQVLHITCAVRNTFNSH